MAGAKKVAPSFHCGMCGKIFKEKQALQMHMISHQEAQVSHECDVCHFHFPDTLLLEQHQIQTGHHKDRAVYACDNEQCLKTFATSAALRKHKQFPNPCSDPFLRPPTKAPVAQHVQYAPPPAPSQHPFAAQVASPKTETVHSFAGSGTPNADDIFCDNCQRSFPSLARYNHHFLACQPAVPSAAPRPLATVGMATSRYANDSPELETGMDNSKLEPTDESTSQSTMGRKEKKLSKGLFIVGPQNENDARNLLHDDDKPKCEIEQVKNFFVATFATPDDMMAAFNRISPDVKNSRVAGKPSVKIYRDPSHKFKGDRFKSDEFTVHEFKGKKPMKSLIEASRPIEAPGSNVQIQALKTAIENLKVSSNPVLSNGSSQQQPIVETPAAPPQPMVSNGNAQHALATKPPAAPPKPPVSQGNAQNTMPIKPPAAPPKPMVFKGPAQHTMPIKPPTTKSSAITPTGPTLASAARSSSQNVSTAAPVAGEFVCNVNGCGRVFKSEPGLKVHRTDAHGVGGKSLDLHGKDSWMLSNRVREQKKLSGLLRGSPAPGTAASPRRAPSVRQAPVHPSPPNLHIGARTGPPLAPRAMNRAVPPSMPTGSSIGSPMDAKQAEDICSKIMRLAIQANIVIHNNGKMTVGGTDWTRVGFDKQRDLVNMFENLIHLPKELQSEYLPPPKAFKDEYDAYYPFADFEPSPAPATPRTAFNIVVVACSKVLLTDGCQEVVKVAAVDLTSCRVLFNHLVCPETRGDVADWRTTTTGLSSTGDFEAARESGYKVFKGWKAVRTALWKFIDSQTILVGHNLRNDLDALRIVHGRAIDVAKVIEKVAEGPLSKAQLSLDTLCRDISKVYPPGASKFGRDYLWNAFAAREITLYRIKNEDTCRKWAKGKSLDYQRLTGRTA